MTLLQSTIDISSYLANTPGGENLQTPFSQTLASFINGAIIIGALALLVYIVWGAVSWITAGGDKGKIESARTKIIQSIIGFVVLVFAYTIYLFVLNTLGVNLGQGGGAGSGGSSNSTSSSGCNPGQRGSDGGKGEYCTGGGSAMMQCFGPGGGVSAFSYNHWEPCYCITGNEVSGYDFSSCN